ncbi:hypothetical protein JK386_01665 [Nocardioides sp. zg-536]|uniref:Uncharacterized protein n=1 Tax=Nocardioides faecalis TaxID=2803858 RepID=A0A938Y6W3_9ACTN|nr:hypothetical protein [Nocardioides faecalis]MBM9458601.1 hypothetical protein [Nocardioides faecalis]MBS4752933.1 hypothetical protein [Nocardioides faecalis]QVI58601.1 hypothetical protein KG111_16755 [Nocardioides faecalis]
MSQPPYGVPPQGAQPPPPSYLGQPQAFAAPPYGVPVGAVLQGLAPASKPRTVGLVVGLATAVVLFAWVVVVAVITSTN